MTTPNYPKFIKANKMKEKTLSDKIYYGNELHKRDVKQFIKLDEWKNQDIKEKLTIETSKDPRDGHTHTAVLNDDGNGRVVCWGTK